MYAITTKELSDEDWKTQLSRGYKNIPANSIVEVIEENFVNFYGNWCVVKYEGNQYYVNKKYLIFKERI